jgi:hypothetical protein
MRCYRIARLASVREQSGGSERSAGHRDGLHGCFLARRERFFALRGCFLARYGCFFRGAGDAEAIPSHPARAGLAWDTSGRDAVGREWGCRGAGGAGLCSIVVA